MYLLIVLALLVLVVYLVFIFPWTNTGLRILTRYAIRQADKRRVLLLCKTDHQALLKAGREILSHESVKKRLHDGRGTAGSFHVPRGMQIPQAIRDLRPGTVLIDYYGYLIIEMHGGMDHFGVLIHPEGASEPYPSFHGGRKLTEGLVYYDERYDYNPDYDKWIDALVEKHKGK